MNLDNRAIRTLEMSVPLQCAPITSQKAAGSGVSTTLRNVFAVMLFEEQKQLLKQLSPPWRVRAAPPTNPVSTSPRPRSAKQKPCEQTHPSFGSSATTAAAGS